MWSQCFENLVNEKQQTDGQMTHLNEINMNEAVHVAFLYK